MAARFYPTTILRTPVTNLVVLNSRTRSRSSTRCQFYRSVIDVGYKQPQKLRSLSVSICPVWLVQPGTHEFWPEWPCLWIRAAELSRSGRPIRGTLESCGGKNVRARLGPFHLNWPEPVLFGWPERTNGKQWKGRRARVNIFSSDNPPNSRALDKTNQSEHGTTEKLLRGK